MEGTGPYKTWKEQLQRQFAATPSSDTRSSWKEKQQTYFFQRLSSAVKHERNLESRRALCFREKCRPRTAAWLFGQANDVFTVPGDVPPQPHILSEKTMTGWLFAGRAAKEPIVEGRYSWWKNLLKIAAPHQSAHQPFACRPSSVPFSWCLGIHICVYIYIKIVLR